jgi:chromosome segregation ATPase
MFSKAYTPKSENLDQVIKLKRETKANLEVEIQKVGEILDSFRVEHKALADDFIYKSNCIDVVTSTLKDLESRTEIAQRNLLELEVNIKSRLDQLDTLHDITDQIECNKRLLDDLLIQIETNKEILKELTSQVSQKTDMKVTLELENERINLQIVKMKEGLNKNEILIQENNKILENITDIHDKNTELLAQLELKKKEFIENPLSIGYYAGVIKNKTGIDIMNVII